MNETREVVMMMTGRSDVDHSTHTEADAAAWERAHDNHTYVSINGTYLDPDYDRVPDPSDA